jgi:hypothetical protein
MAFGVSTDWFSLAVTDEIEIQSSEHSASYATDAVAEDENGDVACRTKAGATDEYTVTYKHHGGTAGVALDTVFGKVGARIVNGSDKIQITGIDVSTDGKDFPSITIKGVKDPAAATAHAEYTSGITYDADKKAQAFGATVVGDTNIISSTVSISGSMAVVEDADGDVAAREPYGVQIKGSHSLQICVGAPSATASAGYTLDSPIGRSESNTGYDTAVCEVFKDLAKDE